MEDLESLGMRPPGIHPSPRIGTSHGGLRKSRYEATKNTTLTKMKSWSGLETMSFRLVKNTLRMELLMEDLEYLGIRLPRPRIHPPGLELLMEDLESLVIRPPRIHPK